MSENVIPMPSGRGLSEAHSFWLEDRKISIEIAANEGLYSIKDEIAIPFTLDGSLQYLKLRKAPGKSFRRDRSGVATLPWGWDSIREASGSGETLIITEGEMDRLSWLTVGAPWVISVPDGAQRTSVGTDTIDPHTDAGFAWMWLDGKLHPQLDKFSTFLISVDDDAPGLVLRQELTDRLDAERCQVVQYPHGCKDANDVLASLGDVALADLVAGAAYGSPCKTVSLLDVSEPEIVRFNIGLPNSLGRHLSPICPELLVVTGTPNSGKSQFARWLHFQIAMHNDAPGLIVQFEDRASRIQIEASRFADTWAKHALTGQKIEDPAAWINRMVRLVVTSEIVDGRRNLAAIVDVIRQAVKRHGVRWVLIDPWNEIDHERRPGETETEYTSRALCELKAVMRALNIMITIIAHPNMGAKDKDIEDLSLYDISGSAAWNNKADHGVVIQREDVATTGVAVKVAKSRWQDVMGRPGTVMMQYRPEAGIYVAQ